MTKHKKQNPTSFNDYLTNKLRDPQLASHFITEAIASNDADYLKVALGDVVKAYGVTYISEKTGLHRQTIYKMLSEEGNPTHKNIVLILDALDLELVVRVKKKAH